MAWLINPLKIELLDKEINLVRIQEIIGDSMIDYIKTKSLDLMQLADPGHPDDVDYRTGSACFLPEDVRLRQLDKMIGRITGLNAFNTLSPNYLASGDLQVASSTFGGHFEPHYDAVI